MGEHRTGKTILEHLESEPRSIHPALGPLAVPGEPLRPPARPAPAPAGQAPAGSRCNVDGALVAREYLAGDSTRTLAERHGCSAQTISMILREQGVPTRPGRRAAATLDGPALAAQHRAGASIESLAVEHGTHTSRISAALREQGITPAPGPRPAAASTPPTPRPPAPSRAPRAKSGPKVDVAAILAQRAAGTSTRQIAINLGVSRSTVSIHIAAANLTPAPPRTQTLPAGDITTAYRAGASIKNLAIQHGAARATITRLLRGAGVTIRPALSPRSIAKQAREGAPVSAPPPDLDPAAIRRLERRGLNTGEIATELGCTIADLHHHYAHPPRRSRTA